MFSNLVYEKVESAGWHFICEPCTETLEETMEADKQELDKLFKWVILDKLKITKAMFLIKEQKNKYLKMIDLFEKRIQFINDNKERDTYGIWADELPGINEAIIMINEFLEAEFAPTIKRLESLKEQADNTKPAANPAEQNTTPTEDYKLSDWYKELSPENQTELDTILEKQENFKPYINKIFNNGYFKIDIDGNPTLDKDKLKPADLKRLIDELAPKGLNGKLKDWENFLDIAKPLKNCSDYKDPKAYIAILEELDIIPKEKRR